MHRPCDSDQVFDPLDSVTEAHRGLTTEQLEVAAILGWGPTRFSERQWRALAALIAWRHR